MDKLLNLMVLSYSLASVFYVLESKLLEESGERSYNFVHLIPAAMCPVYPNDPDIR